MYLNQGNFKFKDITQSAGVTGEGGFKTGVSMVDLNQDGYLDIYVCRSALASNDLRKNVLYINNGDSTFREMAEEYG
ncbi:MAG: FG-GAP repeat domain-containing protein, partial [Flavobacteriaceae bacterium]